MSQKTLKEIPVVRDFAGHRFAGEMGYNVWSTPYGVICERIGRRE